MLQKEVWVNPKAAVQIRKKHINYHKGQVYAIYYKSNKTVYYNSNSKEGKFIFLK